VSNWLGSIVTPETEMLRAQMRSVDTELADEERLQGMAIQEGRDETKKALRRLRDQVVGAWGGSSTEAYALLSGVEAAQLADERRISQETMMDQAAAARMKRQLAEIIPIRQAQETWGAVKDVVGTGAQIAAPFLGPAGVPVAMAGAALAGNDPGSAALAVEGFQAGQSRNVPRPSSFVSGPGQTGGGTAESQMEMIALARYVRAHPEDTAAAARLAEMGGGVW